MPALRNQKHEKFVLALFEGKPQNQAYEEAGYQFHEGNASRLRRNEQVCARLAELQAQAAVDSKVTVESICRELDEANAVAKAKGQAAAMVSAATLRAKLAGLMVERVEVGSPGDFEGCDTRAAIADRIIDELILKFRPVDYRDRQGFLELLDRHCAEMQAYIDAIEARPITAERVDPRKLDTLWETLKPYSPVRLPARSNGLGSK
jgi:hypothetical protein